MEENRNFEVTEIRGEDDYNYVSEDSDSGMGIVGKIVIGVGIAAIGAGTAWLVATKDKRKAKKIEKAVKEAEKAGYVVISPENAVEDEEVLESELVEDEEN